MKNEIKSIPKMKKMIEKYFEYIVENLLLLFIVNGKLIRKTSSE